MRKIPATATKSATTASQAIVARECPTRSELKKANRGFEPVTSTQITSTQSATPCFVFMTTRNEKLAAPHPLPRAAQQSRTSARIDPSTAGEAKCALDSNRTARCRLSQPQYTLSVREQKFRRIGQTGHQIRDPTM